MTKPIIFMYDLGEIPAIYGEKIKIIFNTKADLINLVLRVCF